MKRFLCLTMICFFVSSCAFYNLAKPIDPKCGFPRKISRVDSLHPELKWEPKFEGPYDLIVYELTEKDYMSNRNGRLFYIVDNKVGTSHKIQKQLNYDKIYFWAVRKHSDQFDAEWSNYKYFAFFGIGYVFYWKQPFTFKTPDLPR